MRVAEGVFQFRVPMPSRAPASSGRERYTLVYAIDTPEGWTMVDAGLDSDQGFEALQEQMREDGVTPGDVSLVFFTHGHTDHAGMAARVQDLTGARLAMHRLDASNPQVLTFQPGVKVPRFDSLLDGNEEIVPGSDLWTIWTPGHTPGHLCLHDQRRRLLFTGDHVLPRTTPNVSLYPGQQSNLLQAFLTSHLDLQRLDVEAVHPAHEHSFADLRGRLRELLEHHRRRTDEILTQVRQTPKTAWEVAAAIRWNVGPWETIPLAGRRLALMETQAHLEYLVQTGETNKTDQGPVTLLDAVAGLVSREEEHAVALVGVGRLGRATLAAPRRQGLRIVAAFDADPRQVGETAGEVTVEPVERLGEVLEASRITCAIVAVPPRFAQGVIDQLVACGVTALVNYAPITPRVPPGVRVLNTDALVTLQSATRYGPPGGSTTRPGAALGQHVSHATNEDQAAGGGTETPTEASRELPQGLA